ncbi:hypothetical protein SDC9_174531 [bioreactor metagenome]|uniref:Uncharacterized protein n=1 Tax=bioreactor metagenome TaxID=1076179 RepID=A0A645GSX0_9ZZZZ
MHSSFVKTPAILPCLFGSIHGIIGILANFLHRMAILWINSNADAGCGMKTSAKRLKLLAGSKLNNLLGNLADNFSPILTRQDHNKFVSAYAPNKSIRPSDFNNAFCRFGNHCIAAGVTKRIINQL